ncbi:putative phosphoglycerate mutase [Echinococcus granulosus]|uniref:phosphoglycerate mutase (2,3-diphosphoglycerate-dependent) n=2 Tax=Echinococcus granulosus TaxID=6210 RepID=W6VCB0_ECHGR|nr:putative phosphoglycerate mutase [Echinococcus granulosus]EUB64489.1 putative phosphoglycerate mutase [Echinococcus granulosus]
MMFEQGRYWYDASMTVLELYSAKKPNEIIALDNNGRCYRSSSYKLKMYNAIKSHCYKVAFIRHGESEFNQENKFVGWLDSDLSSRGECEARQAGQMIKQRSLSFDIAYTSVLKRAIKTCHVVLEELDLLWIPVLKSWRLNDRMHGALQGLTQNETTTRYGECQLQLWTKSYDIPPPALLSTDPLLPEFDPRYALLDHNILPKTECLKDTVKRVLPFWHDEIVPAMKKGKRVLIVAHANSIRALLKHIDNIPDGKVMDIEIPSGIPLIYELNADLMPVRHYYLADDSKVAAAISREGDQMRVM